MMNFNTLLVANILVASILANTLSDTRVSQATSNVQTDPTIDHGGQFIVRIGLVLLVSIIVAIVGFFSRRVEHALVAALVLSLCLVAVFAFTK